MKLTEYRGYEVTVEECSGQFQATKDCYFVGWFSTFESLKEKVDKLIKSESTKGFPVEAFQILRSSVVRGKITSCNQEDKSVWFSNSKGKREKISLSFHPDIYLASESNNALSKQLEDKYKLIAQTEKEARAIMGQLTKWRLPKEEATDETKQ